VREERERERGWNDAFHLLHLDGSVSNTAASSTYPAKKPPLPPAAVSKRSKTSPREARIVKRRQKSPSRRLKQQLLLQQQHQQQHLHRRDEYEEEDAEHQHYRREYLYNTSSDLDDNNHDEDEVVVGGGNKSMSFGRMPSGSSLLEPGARSRSFAERLSRVHSFHEEATAVMKGSNAIGKINNNNNNNPLDKQPSVCISTGNIWSDNRVVNYTIREFTGTSCFSINIFVPTTQQSWVIFVPMSEAISELRRIWSQKLSGQGDMDNNNKLGSWLLSCTTLEFANTLIVAAHFDLDAFKRKYTHEIVYHVHAAATKLQSHFRRFLAQKMLGITDDRDKEELDDKSLGYYGRNESYTYSQRKEEGEEEEEQEQHESDQEYYDSDSSAQVIQKLALKKKKKQKKKNELQSGTDSPNSMSETITVQQQQQQQQKTQKQQQQAGRQSVDSATKKIKTKAGSSSVNNKKKSTGKSKAHRSSQSSSPEQPGRNNNSRHKKTLI